MQRIDKPNFTQTPNVLLDNMAEFSDSELRVLLCVCRQTFGWQRGWAKLSRSFVAVSTGMSEQGAVNGLKSLLEKGYLQRANHGDSYSYQLLVDGKPTGQEIECPPTPLGGRGATPLGSEGNAVGGEGGNAVGGKKERVLNKEIKKGGKSLFQKPSIEEVVAFCLSHKLLKSDGEAFFWGKEGNGWKNGPNPVKDWKATIRQWKASGYHPSQKKGGQNFVKPPVNLQNFNRNQNP